jgi:hypothetical protein
MLKLVRILVAVVVLLIGTPLAASTAAAADPGINVPSLLIIQAIRCNDQNDIGGDDEIYITIDGLGRVWSMNGVDEEEWIRIDRSWPFEGSITVHIMEDDGGLTGEDDHIGAWTIPDTARGAFQSLFQFRGYTMWITVTDA